MSEAMAQKIKSLLTKAERSDFPEEAEAFSAKAAELMAKHAIDQAQVMADEGKQFVDIEHRRYTVGSPYSADRMYLVAQVAEALGGSAYFFKQPRDGSKTRTNSKDHNTYAALVGFSSDLDSIESMLESLNKQMERARARAVSRENFWGMGDKKVWNSTFIRTYAFRIGDRLKEAYEAELAVATGGAAIVLRDKRQLIEQELQERKIGKSGKSSRQYNSRGAAAGRTAADSAVLRQGIER